MNDKQKIIEGLEWERNYIDLHYDWDECTDRLDSAIQYINDITKERDSYRHDIEQLKENIRIITKGPYNDTVKV